ncbi:MAG: choice-of-anchor D domain-containing protein, partial [Verrucomicrobiota bacterium]
GTNLVDGASTNNFGSVTIGGNNSLTFTITNTGDADITGLTINIDGADASAFSVTTSPVAPLIPNGSTTFTVRFAPTSTGLKTAALHIASNDSDENPFDIILTGTGLAVATAPEIAVEQPAGSNIPDGGSKDFGSVTIGANNSLTFTIKNTGTADLTGLGLTINGADSSQFSITANPNPPISGPNGTTTFTVRFAPTSTGLKIAALHIASNDSDENPFDITLTGTGTGVVVTTNVVVASVSPITLNPQTGLFEQTVRLSNNGSSTVTAARLLIQSLPSDVRVYNATGTNNGIPFVQHNFSLAPGGSVDFVIEYYRANRQAIPQPVFVAQDTTPIIVVSNGTVIAIDRNVQLASGRFLIEFSATPGRIYAVEYSSDMTNWKAANPTIVAPSNRVQWYDDGPPKTESKPTSGSRFYRVLEQP